MGVYNGAWKSPQTHNNYRHDSSFQTCGLQSCLPLTIIAQMTGAGEIVAWYMHETTNNVSFMIGGGGNTHLRTGAQTHVHIRVCVCVWIIAVG